MKEEFNFAYSCPAEDKTLSLQVCVDHVEDHALERLSDELLLFLHACGYTTIKDVILELNDDK